MNSSLYVRRSGGLLALLVAGLLSSQGAVAQTVMKLGTATINDVQVEAIQRFGKAVEQRSNGRIKAEFYPGAQLGSNPRMIEGLQLGTLEVYVGPPAYLVGVDSRFQVLDAPGLFADSEHYFRVSQDAAFRSAFLALGEPKGIKGVSLFFYGPTAIASRKPIRALSDFKGIKLRVLASRLERESINKLGATAVPIDMSEVSSALQQGTIDGMKSGMSVFSSVKLFDIVKYATDTREAIIPEVMVVAKPWFDAQPEDIRKIILEEGKAMERHLFDWTNAALLRAESDWKKHGAEIIQLSGADREKMMSELANVADTVLSARPAEKQMFELLKQAVNRTKK